MIKFKPMRQIKTSKRIDRVVKMSAITRAAVKRRIQPTVLKDKAVRQVRIERIKPGQEEEI